MRTRYLNIDYFTATPTQALESLTFLHLPILPLPPSNLSTAFDGIHLLRFDSELEVALQIEQLPIGAALTKFFSDVLPQNIVLDVSDFEPVGPSPSSRSFGSGSRELQFSEKKAEDLKNEKGLEDQITFGSETLETAFRKDNGRRDAEKDAHPYEVLRFETPELDVFLENAYIYEKEELPFLSEEVPETENNLEMLNLTVKYPWEVHESVHTVKTSIQSIPRIKWLICLKMIVLTRTKCTSIRISLY